MRSVGVMLMAGVLSGVAVAQGPMSAPAGAAGEVQAAYNRVKMNALKAAEKMPAESYSFKPHPDIRTFARVVNHISEAQLGTCGRVNGTAPADSFKVPAETAGKDAVIEALKASFAACDKAYASVTDANLAEMLPAGNNKRSRIGMLWGNVSHDNEQYAILSDYLRDKDLAPPTSEK